MTLQQVSSKLRISSIDIVRGIVMVIMALDHTRDFFHHDSLHMDPTDMKSTYPALFFTRIITHFCAPTFVMLAGTSICISAQRKSKHALALFLLTRGIWLIFAEVVIVRFGIVFNLYYDFIIFQVIWAIGASMVVMAALVYLTDAVLISLAALILFGHNLFDKILLSTGDTGFWPWLFFHQSGFARTTDGTSILVPYPVLPWLGIMLGGYVLGMLYRPYISPQRRPYYLMVAGASAIGLFVLLRLLNHYGDPSPWGVQKNGLFTVMSFLNTTKYPPSLLYTLMTLGPVLILLGIIERYAVRWTEPFIVFGRVPLFYYVLHFYLIHGLAIACYMYSTGKSWAEIDFHFGQGFGGVLPDGGYSLLTTYFVWMGVVLALYPLCRLYNRYKSTHTQWWLSYL